MRNFLTILVVALAVISCQSAKNEFSIKGSIAGVEKGKVYLQKLVNGQLKVLILLMLLVVNLSLQVKWECLTFEYSG